jgi:hypothetical protein
LTVNQIIVLTKIAEFLQLNLSLSINFNLSKLKNIVFKKRNIHLII